MPRLSSPATTGAAVGRTTGPTADRGADSSRRLLLVALPLVLVVGVVALVLAGSLTGAFAPTPLLDAGGLARWGLPVTTFVEEMSSALTLGGLLLACGIVRPGATTRAALGVTGAAACVWAVAAVLRLVFTASVALGVPVTDAGFGEQFGYFAMHIGAGRTLLGVTIIACLTATLALLVATPTGAAWTAALAVAALAVQAQSGHSSAAGSHDLAITSIFLHVTGAAVWIGALGVVVVLWLRRRLASDELPDVVARYSAVAGWAYAVVAVSGVVSAMIRLGSWGALSSRYGLLIIVKVVLFVVLGGFGFSHRRWVVSRLGALADGARATVSARTRSREAHRPDAPVRAAAGRLFWRLVAVELLVMGVVSGVAVALASSAPPDDNALTELTPAVIVTGHALPPALTFARYFTQWRVDLLFAVVAAAGLVVYLVWAVRLRRRGDRWSLWRTASWCFGIVLFGWVTSGGPAAYGHVLFSAHMLEHMMLAMVIPIFLTCGAPVTLAVRALPGRKDQTRGPREWILVLVHSRWGQFFANPIVAAVNFAGSLVVFYYSPAFEYALTTTIGHVIMVVHFSLAGYLFVNALVGIDPGPTRPGYPQRLLLLLATMAFHAFFGVALMSNDNLLVAQWFGLLGRPWGESAIADQQSGGGITWGIGEIPTIVLSIIVAVRWSSSDERDAKRRDRQADRDGDAELNEYNAMLARLSEKD